MVDQPLTTAQLVKGDLPSPVDDFIGRSDDVKRVAAEFVSRRLVTLTGVGGVGNTRLAIESAATLLDQFPDGVWFVELAPVADPQALPAVFAAVLGVRPEAGVALTDSIVDVMRTRRALLSSTTVSMC